MALLSENYKSKITEINKAKFIVKFLQLAPSDTSGRNICPEASPVCKADCLFYAGMGNMQSVQQGRINKTHEFFEDRKGFLKNLDKELVNFAKNAEKKGLAPAIRLNALSDLPWEKLIKMEDYPIQFYDYTKVRRRYESFLAGKMPENYHLTFSRSEINEKECLKYLEAGGNVAVVGEKRPRRWNGFITLDADKHDLRFLDKPQRVAWLKPKGRIKKDLSGFVIRD